MTETQLNKRWTRRKTRLLPMVIGAGMFFSGFFPATAHALFVDGPGRVLMIDGTDRQSTVETFDIDLTIPLSRYEFGFVGTSGFARITSNSNQTGSYTFQGGSLVNFALRNRSTGQVYSIADPADYADQVYVDPISSSNSRNPQVPFTYYSTLVLEWDLSHSGNHPFNNFPSGMPGSAISELRMGTSDVGFAVITATSSRDGFASAVPAPVPLPASILLFGSGLLGMSMGWKRFMGMVG